MSEMRKYGVGQLFTFPLIEDGDADFVTDYTPAAGDAKLWSDTQISTNLTSLILGFDSLSERPAQGAQIDENGAGTAEGVVEFTVIVSGTVGGGDAAGFFIMRSVTGQAWSNDDQIDINGGTANIATADSTTYDLAATAGLIAEIGNGLFAAALSPTEMTCSLGAIHIIDSPTKAIEDQAVRFNTFGNAAALHAVDLDDSVRLGLTALPNAAADAAGGLPISPLGSQDLDALDGVSMRGTDDAALASVATEARLAELDGANLPSEIAAIPTTAMRGTDGANTTTPPTVGAIADAVQDEPIEDHVAQGTSGYSVALGVYAGSDGPGIYIDSGAANTNTVVGTDGTEANPVSTFAAARTLADALGLKIYYLEGNSDITLAATHEDWEFIGIGSVADNVVNLGSQDVDRSLFRNLTIEGTQGGTGRITARDCALQDPGAGATTLHIFAERCGVVDDISVDTSADNVFDECFSLAPSGVAPIITATGAAGSIIMSHWGGKIELKGLSASHNIELDGIGSLTFNADCNVNANLAIDGIWDVTDNTAGMNDLATMVGLINMTKINTEVDTGISDAALATAANLATVDAAVAAIQAVTDLLPDAGALNDLAAILIDTGTALPATLAALNDLAAADVAAELATYDGPTKAEMDAAHALLATEAKQDLTDTAVDAIGAVTGQMVFTKANELDGNMKSINNAGVVGDGDATPWDGA